MSSHGSNVLANRKIAILATNGFEQSELEMSKFRRFCVLAIFQGRNFKAEISFFGKAQSSDPG